jgi:hypothetical protein
MGGLIGLLTINIAGILSGVFYGPNAFMYTAHSFDLFIGSALFTAFIAYDTHQAILMYKMGNPDHLQVIIENNYKININNKINKFFHYFKM